MGKLYNANVVVRVVPIILGVLGTVFKTLEAKLGVLEIQLIVMGLGKRFWIYKNA